MSQSMPKGVRRAQLSLAKQQRNASTDSSSNDEKIKSVTIDLTKINAKPENGSSKKKENGSNSNGAATTNAETTVDGKKISKDNGVKQTDSKSSSNDKAASTPIVAASSVNLTEANGTKKEAAAEPKQQPKPETPKKDEAKEIVVTPRESPRQKAKEKDAAKEELDKSNDLSNVITPDTPDLTPSKESPKPSPKIKKPGESPKKTTSENPPPPSSSSSTTSSLPATDKNTIGGSDKNNGIEMPSLILESDIEDSPMPGKKPTGKILKLKQGPHSSTRSRVSPFRRYTTDKQQQQQLQQNDSTAVNLSTVSESAEVNVPLPTTPLYEDKKFNTSLRAISGRKSMREIREITFYNSRDTYRKLNESLNSSMNVTVGSVSAYNEESLFSVSGRKRVSDDNEFSATNVSIDSPKRARLDFSGFLNVLASPVTALRAKFSRAQIKCSTPNETKLTEDENEMKVDDGGGVTTETVSSGIETEATIDVTMDVADVVAMNPVVVVVGDDNDNASSALNEKQIEEGVDVLVDDDDEPPIEVKEIKKNRCSVM